MFQAYLDETEKGSVFMLAGYVATSESWATFTVEWQKHLDYRSPHHPTIEAYHSRELRAPRYDERKEWFYRVIEDHVHCAVALLIDLSSMRRAFDAVVWPIDKRKLGLLTNPYVIAFRSLISGIPTVQHEVGIRSPISFVFDESVNKERCLIGWQIMKESLAPTTLAKMGETPSFHDDKKVLPLQAADLFAEVVRGWAEELLARRKVEPKFAWPVKRIYPVMHIYLDEERLRRGYEQLAADMQRRIATGELIPPVD